MALPRPRWQGLLLPLLASLVVLGFDWLSHPFLFRGYGKIAATTYVVTAILSAAMWWAWASLIAHRSRPARIVGVVVVVLAGTLIVGSQRYVVDRYGVLVDKSYVSGGVASFASPWTIIWNDKWTILRAEGPPLLALSLVAVVLLKARDQFVAVRARIAIPLAMGATIVASFASPSRYAEGAEPLDVLALAAIGEAARAGFHDTAWAIPGKRTPVSLPPLARTEGVPRRNTLLFVTESVRAENTCLRPADGCKETPFSHRLTPSRVALRHVHSLASNTAPAVVVLWSGLGPSDSREDVHTAPLIWDYAKAAGYDSTYWTAQDLAFGNMQMYLEGIPARHRVSAADLDRERDSLVGADEHLLASHVEAHAKELVEPFLAIIHLSNTHMPYRVDEDDKPWVPETTEGGVGHEAEVLNRYRDAIWAQDKQVARMIEAFRRTPAGSRTVIMFTSDHGEQFREHGTMGHSNTLTEPEIHVPLWVDAPPGTLTESERASLASAADVPLTHTVVLPTVLDLIGVYDAPEIAARRVAMHGTSLLRPRRQGPEAPVVITNCSGIAACPRPTWGAIAGALKVLANDGDRGWRCHDILSDPEERTLLTHPLCDELVRTAEAGGRGTPFRIFK